MENPIPNYEQRQVMLSLSYLAYCGDLITTPNPENTILDIIKNAIPLIPPVMEWKVVWGPETYTPKGAYYQDYMMFIAQNTQDTTQFAIAIRGTNSVSDLDWLMGDFDILQMMPWPLGSALQTPVGKMISESTSVGMEILLGMTSTIYGGSNSNAPISWLDFLHQQTQNGTINICVTGHSLGGCLAGTLALYLKENTSLWDANSNSIVTTITFAAPTAGNAEFATHSDNKFATSVYPPNWDETLNTTFDAVRCSFDIAPLGWISTNVASLNGDEPVSPIFSLYVPNIDFTQMEFPYDDMWSAKVPFGSYYGILPDVIAPLGNLLTTQNYAQTVAGAALLPGNFNGDGISDDSFENTAAAFISQVAYQHSKSYPALLDVEQLSDPNIIKENTNDIINQKPSARLLTTVQTMCKMATLHASSIKKVALKLCA